MARIGFVLGSTSDLDQIEGAKAFLEEVDVPYEVRILSAHRTPNEAHAYAKGARGSGLQAIIAMAGLAAHLAGAMAAVATVPVLGVPARGGPLNGLDALLSTVQMPGGVPVATFAIGKPGATNAAIFACQMMALHDAGLEVKLAAHRDAMRERVLKADKETRA